MLHPDLVDSVKPYDRHLFVATGRTDWPGHLDESGGILGRIANDVLALEASSTARTKVTAIDDRPASAGVDLFVYPEALRFVDVDEPRWRIVLENVLRRSDLPGGLPLEPLEGVHLFVCVHGARDERCGRCGPPLATRLLAETAGRAGMWHVHRTSHVGGHKYAGNVIAFPSGDWYGYVTPEDVPRLLDAIEAGRIVDDLWRGRMGRFAP